MCFCRANVFAWQGMAFSYVMESATAGERQGLLCSLASCVFAFLPDGEEGLFNIRIPPNSLVGAYRIRPEDIHVD